jgi:hypothetical protein
MKYEDTAYGKFGLSMTDKQIKKWNKVRMEMWGLVDFLCDRHQMDGHYDKASRLKDLIGQLPIFETDENGFSRSGNAIDSF